VVPADDSPVAQCIARAPGGPTHVLLDDRTAEHVPGCNMAFRRDALVAIGGFNPVFLRAGDDVDVCWRLQARGWKIGFSAAALVWHHHRASVKAYWRQQVGYGEGETWLMAHHPDKFLDGRMLWHGRIYSPLPFVQSLSGTRINAGVWGSAAFPSVYRTDVHPFAFLPHSIKWQVLSFILLAAGAVIAWMGEHQWAAAILLGGGAIGAAATIAKNVAYALRSDMESLRGPKIWYRAQVAFLHFLQPIARLRGRIRGVLSPPEVALPPARAQTSRGPRPSLSEAWRALVLLAGNVAEDRFWSESWTSAERVLTELVEWLRQSRAVRTIEVDEGWSDDRDVSVFVGRWAWLDIRALVETHDAGRSLVRLSTHLRPTIYGVVTALALGTTLLVAAIYGVAVRWPLAGAAAAGLAVLAIPAIAWKTAQTTAIVRRGIARVTVGAGMVQLPSAPAHAPLVSPSLLRMYGLRSAIIFMVTIVTLGASTFMLREAATAPVIGGRQGFAGDYGPAIEAWLDAPGGIVVAQNGDIYFADSNNHVIRRIDARNGVITTAVGNHDLDAGFSGDDAPATEAQLDTPDGVAILPDGDLVIADSRNDRIRRVDRATGVITTIAGSGVNGYDGDDKPALEAALNTPSAVAAAPNGDIYIADTLNYRVRVLDAKTGVIRTVAGDGTPGEPERVGDGGPATSAQLNMPSDVAVAPSGDVYIADMHHNRVRKIDVRTGLISTVAGSGIWGYAGDDGPAVEARLAGPAGIALAPDPGAPTRLTIFIADFYNQRVRAVGPDGMMRDLTQDGRIAFGAPTRVVYAPRRGWLYVADSSDNRIVPLPIPKDLVAPRPTLLRNPMRRSSG
jgi:DNA-binding beta-propeller fold protein YncE